MVGGAGGGVGGEEVVGLGGGGGLPWGLEDEERRRGRERQSRGERLRWGGKEIT